MGGKQKKAWNIRARFAAYEVNTVMYASTLPKVFWRFAKMWSMDNVLEIRITEVLANESEGISGADQMV